MYIDGQFVGNCCNIELYVWNHTNFILDKLDIRFLSAPLLSLFLYFCIKIILIFNDIISRVNHVNLYIEIFSAESKATEFTDVHDPATNQLLCRTPKCTKDEMESAVQCARKAYEKWRNTSVLTRQNLMLKYQALIREHSVSHDFTF